MYGIENAHGFGFGIQHYIPQSINESQTLNNFKGKIKCYNYLGLL